MPALAPEIGTRSLAGGLRFRAVAGGNAITRLVEVDRSAPMQLQRPLYLDAAHPGLATVQIINSTAGLFAGDDIRLHVDVSSGARLALSTPTMTRVYAMPDDGVATNRIYLRVRAGGYLEYAPAATILCRDASLYQETRIDIDRDACAAIGEVWVFGRAAHGELRAFRHLNVRSELHVAQTLVLADALTLRPGDRSCEAAVGTFVAYGTLALVGPEVGTSYIDRVRRKLNQGSGTLAGASLLPRDGGIGMRVLGASASSVQSVLQELIAEFRKYALGDESRRAQNHLPDASCGGAR